MNISNRKVTEGVQFGLGLEVFLACAMILSFGVGILGMCALQNVLDEAP